MLILQRVFLMAAFSMWFGGFGFYASTVVPIGTAVLGTPIEQGAITQQVTNWINIFSGIALLAMAIESAIGWQQTPKGIRWLLLSLNLGMIASLGTLIYLHPIMDAMFDPSDLLIQNSEQFYSIHRVYLWTSTVQWILGWIWLVALILSWTPPKQTAATNPMP